MARMMAVTALALGMAAAAGAQDRAEYYYPPITSSETFDRTLAAAPAAERAVRVAFVTQVTRQQLTAPHPPRYAMFAKGARATELVIVALDDEVFSTLYRARAVMAQLSAPARTTDFFVQQELSDVATFYDMLKIMGFEELILSDGRHWSHRVAFR